MRFSAMAVSTAASICGNCGAWNVAHALRRRKRSGRKRLVFIG
jgi:hypothetical protein